MKPVIGRAPKAPSDDRHLIVLRVPRAVAQRFTELAAREHLSRSAWARRVLLEKCDQQVSA